MTSEHNLEENEGIHTPQPPRAVSHREWENRSPCESKLQVQYPGERQASVVIRKQEEGFRGRWRRSLFR